MILCMQLMYWQPLSGHSLREKVAYRFSCSCAQAEQGHFHRQQAERQQALCSQLQASLAETQAVRHTAEQQLQQLQLNLGSEQSKAQLRAMVTALQQEVRLPAMLLTLLCATCCTRKQLCPS